MAYYDKEKVKKKECCEEGYLSFLEDNNWKYNFDKEYSKSDTEQSFLSRMIFCSLFKNMNYMCELPKGDDIAIKVSKENWLEPCYFLFDVMHNPKEGHQPYILAKKMQKQLRFDRYYHTIGNFAPVPRTIVYKRCGPNLQLKHKHLSELWCRFLKYMQENWEKWPTKIHEKITFKEYMICSCQHLYYKQIFDEVYSKYRRNTSLNRSNWKNEVDNWNKKIREVTFDEELISIDNLLEEENIEEIDVMINFLIEARGHCILCLLKK